MYQSHLFSKYLKLLLFIGSFQVAALRAISNIVVDFTNHKLVFIQNGAVKQLVQLSKSMDSKLRLNAVWALRNLAFLADRIRKDCILQELTISTLASLIYGKHAFHHWWLKLDLALYWFRLGHWQLHLHFYSADPEPPVQEQSLALVCNLVDGGVDSIEHVFLEDSAIINAVAKQVWRATTTEVCIRVGTSFYLFIYLLEFLLYFLLKFHSIHGLLKFSYKVAIKHQAILSIMPNNYLEGTWRLLHNVFVHLWYIVHLLGHILCSSICTFNLLLTFQESQSLMW